MGINMRTSHDSLCRVPVWVIVECGMSPIAFYGNCYWKGGMAQVLVVQDRLQGLVRDTFWNFSTLVLSVFEAAHTRTCSSFCM